MPKLVTISNTRIRNAKSRPKEYNLSAGSGLHLRVSPTGSKTWLLNHSPPHSKKRTNLSLGKYPTMSLSDAIAIRDDYQYMLHKDKDPQQERTRELTEFASTNAMTFQVVYEKCLTLKIATLSKNYIKRLDNAMILHVLPLLGNTPISAITAPDTIAVLTPISMNQNFETLRKICG